MGQWPALNKELLYPILVSIIIIMFHLYVTFHHYTTCRVVVAKLECEVGLNYKTGRGNSPVLYIFRDVGWSAASRMQICVTKPP